MPMNRFDDDRFAARRQKMVERQIKLRGIHDERVIQAMARVPRHIFVPENLQHLSYEDTPLPIGGEQTISQPYIVAYMIQALELEPEHRVLEVGTGSGYQAALLAQIAAEVYTIEIVPELYEQAKQNFALLGLDNIYCKLGDGSLGWPEYAPFDRIIGAASPSTIPKTLLEQLCVGGIMVLPVGNFDQVLMKVKKTGADEIDIEEGPRVKFVPMTGMAEKMN